MADDRVLVGGGGKDYAEPRDCCCATPTGTG